MPRTLHDIVQLLLSSSTFIVVVLAPFPASAIPIPPQDSPASSETPSPESSHMDHRVIFGIVFAIVLFVVIEVGYAYVGSRVPFAWIVEVKNRASQVIRAASVTVIQRLSSLRLFSFVEKAANAFVDANDVGASSTRGRSGGTQGGTGDFSRPTISHPAPAHV